MNPPHKKPQGPGGALQVKTLQAKKSPAAPPVYRPSPPRPRVVQSKAVDHQPSAVQLKTTRQPPVAPPVYRPPQPNPQSSQAKAVGDRRSVPPHGVRQQAAPPTRPFQTGRAAPALPQKVGTVQRTPRPPASAPSASPPSRQQPPTRQVVRPAPPAYRPAQAGGRAAQPFKSLNARRPVGLLSLNTIQRLPTLSQIKKMTDGELKKAATDADNPTGGHGLARHQPDLPDSVLKERLLTGYIHGVFSPSPGISTKWSSYKLYLICRVRATEAMREAHDHTWAKIGAAITTHRTAVAAWTNAVGAAKGALVAPMGAAWVALNALAQPLTVHGNTYYLPIRVIGAPTFKIRLCDAYNIVLRHDDLPSLGEGFRGVAGKEKTIDNPNGVIDPATGAVRRETLYTKWEALGHGLHQAATTFETDGGDFTQGQDVSAWVVRRHYPDNRQPGFY